MKIVHIISSGGMYGAEAVILDLSRCLEREGHRSLIAVFANSAQRNTEFEDRARAQGFETHILPCRGQLDCGMPARIQDLVRTTGADVVHAHGYKADVYAYWALRRSGTALVSTCHNWLDNSLALRLYGALDRHLLRSFHRIVAVSAGIRNRLLEDGVREDKIQLIHNGVDMGPFASIERSSPAQSSAGPLKVGVAARLSPEKGVDVFLRGAALVHQKMPEAHFLVGGDGPDRAALQALIDELQLGSSATLLGRQEHMPAFYAGLDLAVLPSRVEGLPMALLEAMASGLPVVATAVGEIPQVLRHGRTGLVVKPEDPSALAEAMIELLSDAPRRLAMGTEARFRVAESFSGDRMTADYLNVYKQALVEARS